jgi:hypothetical protein
MRGFVSFRRLVALLGLATLGLAGGAPLAAIGADAVDCAQMAAPMPTGHGSGHDCAPAARVVSCSEAPCCALAPLGHDEGREVVPASPGPLADAPLQEVAHRTAPWSPPTATLAPPAPPGAPSGRERLALHAILLI